MSNHSTSIYSICSTSSGLGSTLPSPFHVDSKFSSQSPTFCSSQIHEPSDLIGRHRRKTVYTIGWNATRRWPIGLPWPKTINVLILISIQALLVDMMIRGQYDIGVSNHTIQNQMCMNHTWHFSIIYIPQGPHSQSHLSIRDLQSLAGAEHSQLPFRFAFHVKSKLTRPCPVSESRYVTLKVKAVFESAITNPMTDGQQNEQWIATNQTLISDYWIAAHVTLTPANRDLGCFQTPVTCQPPNDEATKWEGSPGIHGKKSQIATLEIERRQAFDEPSSKFHQTSASRNNINIFI